MEDYSNKFGSCLGYSDHEIKILREVRKVNSPGLLEDRFWLILGSSWQDPMGSCHGGHQGAGELIEFPQE